MSSDYQVAVNGQRITVSWGKQPVWLMPFSMENWRLVLDFVDAFRLKGYKVEVSNV